MAVRSAIVACNVAAVAALRDGTAFRCHRFPSQYHGYVVWASCPVLWAAATPHVYGCRWGCCNFNAGCRCCCRHQTTRWTLSDTWHLHAACWTKPRRRIAPATLHRSGSSTARRCPTWRAWCCTFNNGGADRQRTLRTRTAHYVVCRVLCCACVSCVVIRVSSKTSASVRGAVVLLLRAAGVDKCLHPFLSRSVDAALGRCCTLVNLAVLYIACDRYVAVVPLHGWFSRVACAHVTASLVAYVRPCRCHALTFMRRVCSCDGLAAQALPCS